MVDGWASGKATEGEESIILCRGRAKQERRRRSHNTPTDASACLHTRPATTKGNAARAAAACTRRGPKDKREAMAHFKVEQVGDSCPARSRVPLARPKLPLAPVPRRACAWPDQHQTHKYKTMEAVVAMEGAQAWINSGGLEDEEHQATAPPHTISPTRTRSVDHDDDKKAAVNATPHATVAQGDVGPPVFCYLPRSSHQHAPPMTQ